VASITAGFPQSNIDKTGGGELLKTGLAYVRAMTIVLWNASGVGRWRAAREPAVREPLEHLPLWNAWGGSYRASSLEGSKAVCWQFAGSFTTRIRLSA
jgi:hypothetical protein